VALTIDYSKVAPEGNIFLPRECKITHVKQVTKTERHFTLRHADNSKVKFNPGQILEVSLFGFGEIPLGYASSPTRENTFDIVIRTVGRVSTALNKLSEGDSLYVRGPLGSGFPLNELQNQNILVVAGGIGLCPTRSMIQYITDRRNEFKNFTLFYGARDPSQQMFHEDIAKWKAAKDADPGDKVEDYQVIVSLRPDCRWPISMSLYRNLGSDKSEWTMPESFLNPGTAYYWRVRARDSHGEIGQWGKIFSFRTTDRAK